MLRRTLCSILVLTLTLSVLGGCAHKQAIDRANTYAERGDWRAAHAQCQRALEIDPESEEARACAADTRPKATAAALEDARAELRAQEYASALDHLDYVDSIHEEPPTQAAQLRTAIREAVESRLHAYLENGQMEKAYEFAGTADALYPEAAFVDEAYSTCRAHFLEQAASFEEKQEYAAAVSALDTIKTHEPDRSDEIEREQTRIEELWADSLEARARTLEADEKRGGAVVMYARAYELSGREKARVQLRRLTAALSSEAQFGVRWKFDGPSDWTTSFEESLLDRLAAGMQPVSESPELELEFDLESSDCTDAATGSTHETREYVAGTRRVDNPAYDELQDELVSMRATLEDARTREAELSRAHDHARREVSEHQTDVVDPTRQQLQDARARERTVSGRVQSDRQLLDEAVQELRRLRNDEDASDTTIDRQQRRVETLRDDVDREEARLEEARRDRRRLEDELEDVKRELEELRDERERLFGLLSEAETEVSRTEAEIARLETELRSTPRTIEEDVTDTFTYEVITWKRTCKADVELGVVIADIDKEYVTHIEASAATEDSTHPSYKQYGIDRDPLSFPTDDVELWNQVDERLADEAYETIHNSARKYWNRRIGEAVGAMSDRPHHAADVLLGIYLTVPDALDSGEATALEEHLQEHYEASPLEVIAGP